MNPLSCQSGRGYFYEVKLMAKMYVNGQECPTPSVFQWSLQDISQSDAGRTQDGIMHKNRTGQKRKIQLQWNAPKPEVASRVLQLFNGEYFDVTYPDPLSNATETRTFYRGDANAPVYWWCNGGLYENVSFNIIER